MLLSINFISISLIKGAIIMLIRLAEIIEKLDTISRSNPAAFEDRKDAIMQQLKLEGTDDSKKIYQILEWSYL